MLVGSSSEDDVAFPWTRSGYGAPATLPPRRGQSTARFSVGDVDLDGDQDVVAMRDRHTPAILFNQHRQISSSVTQLGRPLVVRARAEG